MSKLCATLNLVLTPLGIVVPESGTWTIISFISTKNFAEGIAMIADPFTFTLQDWSAAGHIPGSVRSSGVVTIPATAVKVKLENGMFVIRIEDTAALPMVGNLIGSGTINNFTENWIVSDPGQTKVLAK